MTITLHPDVVQGSQEWHDMRCGLLTASEMKLILTPTLKVASNEKERSHLYELLAQRLTGYVEPHYVGDDMLRGKDDEIKALMLYQKHFARVDHCGFITNDRFGFTLGFSPDALVGDDGFVEVKSRRQKFQIETITENACPAEFMLQIQAGLLVSGRKWCDFISYSGGLPMFVRRVGPDADFHAAIIEAAMAFEERLVGKLKTYEMRVAAMNPMVETERTIEQEIHL